VGPSSARAAAFVVALIGVVVLAFVATSRPVPGPSEPPASVAIGLPQPGASLDASLGSASTAAPNPSSMPSAESGVVATRIEIPRLGIDLPVVEGDGVDAPIGKAAHYPGTSWPDGGSNIYLYAHARKSMFLDLWQAQLGDKIFLDLIDGSERIYTVSQIEPDIPWNDMDVLDPTPAEQLSLQTCTSVDPKDPRFLVIATRAG
jgi:sortase A